MFQRCTAMLDRLPAIVSYVGTDLRFQFANATHLDWTGRTSADLLGQHMWAVMRPELRATVEPLVARALAGERVEAELALPQGLSRRFVRLMVIPDTDERGIVIGLGLLATDMTDRCALEEQLRRSETMFHKAFEAAGVGKVLADGEGRLFRVNDAFATMLGYTRAEVEGVNYVVLTHPDDINLDLAQFEALKAGEIESYDVDKRFLHRDGHFVYVTLNVTAVRDGRAASFFVVQVIDVTAARLASQKLRDTNAPLMLAMEVLEGGVWEYDIATDVIDISAGLARVFGFEAPGPISLDALRAIIHRDDLATASLERLIRGDEGRATALYRIASANGRTRWIRDRRQLIRDEAGRPAKLLGVAVDVTAERANETRLEREAVTDPLTGLLNRRGFHNAVDDVLAKRACGDRVAMLVLDLDRFKPINDGFGHAAGDLVLREVARRISGQVRSTDVAARLGGDEFALLLPCADAKAAERAASRIVAALAVPYTAGEVTVAATASVGVAMAGDDATTASLIERADAALYEVKRSGRGKWALAA